MNEGAHEAETKVVEIRLRDGETIKAKTKDRAGTSIASLHQTLQGSEFVQVGEDTIVRSADVQSIQIRDRDSGGLMDTLRSRVGGDGGHDDEPEHGRAQHRAAAADYRPRDSGPSETKPFFLTSEFLLAFIAWIALLITSVSTDSVDEWSFSLLSIAIATGYMLSRGFAKANTPSRGWDPREGWHPGR
jgi:hypothetical protein